MKSDVKPVSKCQCWTKLPSSEKVYVVKMCIFSSFFITSVVLLDTAHPDNSGNGRTRFWTGLGMFLLGIIAVWWTTSSFLHTLLEQATAKAKDKEVERAITYIRTSMLYYPIYVTSVYVMSSYALFMIFRLDDWNLVMGASLLFITTVLLLMFLFESGRGIMRLAKTYMSDAFDTLSKVTPEKAYNTDGGDNKKLRSMRNAQYAIAKSKRAVVPRPAPTNTPLLVVGKREPVPPVPTAVAAPRVALKVPAPPAPVAIPPRKPPSAEQVIQQAASAKRAEARRDFYKLKKQIIKKPTTRSDTRKDIKESTDDKEHDLGDNWPKSYYSEFQNAQITKSKGPS